MSLRSPDEIFYELCGWEKTRHEEFARCRAQAVNGMIFLSATHEACMIKIDELLKEFKESMNVLKDPK